MSEAIMELEVERDDDALEVRPDAEALASELEELFADANRVGDINTRLRAALPHMDIEQIFETARYAHEFERGAYMLRGACAAELVERAERLPGGAGKRDLDGKGVRAAILRLAKEAGVDARTIDQDYQIYATFYAGKTVDESSTVSGSLPAPSTPPPAPGLNREMHVLALKADDPQAALELFATKAALTSDYTAVKAAADLSEMRGGKSPKALEDIHWVNVPFNRNDIQLLGKIAVKLGMCSDPEKAVLRDVTIESVRRFWAEYLAFSRKPEHVKPAA